MKRKMAEKLQETALKKGKILFGFVVIALLTLYQNFNILYQETKPPEILWAVLAVSALLLGKMWKDHGYRTLLLLYVIIVLRAYIGERDRFWWGEYTFFYGLLAYLVCYPFAQAVDRDWLPKLLRIGGILWVVSVTALSAMGLYALWTGTKIYNLSNTGYFGLNRFRLELLYNYNTGAAIESYTIIIALILMAAARGKAGKLLLLLSVVIMWLALSLSDSRTSFIVAGFSIGCFVAILISSTCRLFGKIKEKNRILFRIVLSAFIILCILLTSVSSYLLFDGAKHLFVNMRNNGIVATAEAEETEAGKETLNIPDRSLLSSDGSLALSGRDRIWSGVFRYLQENPQTLLTGTSVISAMDGPNAMEGSFVIADPHSLYIMTLLESGIPGLLLLLFYIVLFAVSCVRVWRNKQIPLWVKLLPVIAVNILINGLTECIPCIIYGLPNLYHLHLVIGVTVLYGKKSKIAAKARKELAA